MIGRTRRRAAETATFMAVLAIGCGAGEAADAEIGGAVADRDPVPATTFATLEGGTASLPEMEGRVLVVNFWGTWCVPCRREIPELVELHAAYADQDVEIIGIAVESGDAEEIRTFLARYGAEYHIWTTDMATALADFQAVGYPFTILVDRDGGIASTYYGPQTLELLSAEVDALLN